MDSAADEASEKEARSASFGNLSPLPAIKDGNLGIGGDADKPWFRAEGHSLSEYGREFAGTLGNGDDGSAVIHANDRANPVVEKDEIASAEAKWPTEFQASGLSVKQPAKYELRCR